MPERGAVQAPHISQRRSEERPSPAGFDQHRQWVENQVLEALRVGRLDQAEAILRKADLPDISLSSLFQLHHAEREAQTAQLLQMRQRTEQTLAWFAGLYQSLPIAALVIDPQGLITSANAVALDELGLGQVLKVRPIPLRRLMATPEGQMEVERAVRNLGDAQTCRLHELSLSLPTKGQRWADLCFTRLPASDLANSTFGGRAQWICVLHDRTESVEMRNTQQAAERAQHERDVANSAARAKGELVSRISHEFRTPLNAIMGFSELLLYQPGRFDAAATDQLRHIYSAGSHLLRLVDSILRINRSEAGRLEPELGPQPVRELLLELTQMMMPLCRPLGISMELEGVQENLYAKAQQALLREVLENLISNAIKYNRAKGWVRLRAWQDTQQVHVAVADSGRGLTPEQLAHLYEPFNRLGAEKLKLPGSGLGLSLARDSVNAMQGSLDVVSEPGVGTCFTLSLPAASAPARGSLASA